MCVGGLCLWCVCVCVCVGVEVYVCARVYVSMCGVFVCVFVSVSVFLCCVVRAHAPEEGLNEM